MAEERSEEENPKYVRPFVPSVDDPDAPVPRCWEGRAVMHCVGDYVPSVAVTLAFPPKTKRLQVEPTEKTPEAMLLLVVGKSIPDPFLSPVILSVVTRLSGLLRPSALGFFCAGVGCSCDDGHNHNASKSPGLIRC